MFAFENWYIAARSEEVHNAPLGRKFLNQDVVLFRTQDGEVCALGAVCAHRGADLGKGRIVGSSIQCPWHGWQYGADGRCNLVPSQGPCGKIPRGARVPVYPLHEAQGYIHIWMKPDTQPTWYPPAHDFFNTRYHIKSPVRFQRGSFINTVEAACDDAHVYIAHAQTIGMAAPAHLAPIIDVKSTEDGRAVQGRMVWPIERKRSFKGLSAWYQKHLLGLGEDSNTHDRHYRVELSGLVVHRYPKADGFDFIVYAATTPADEFTNWFFAGTIDTHPQRSFIGNFLYWLARNRTSRVFDEDEDMITSTLTDNLPGGHPRPISVNSDAMGLAFRRLYARQVLAEGGTPAWPVAGMVPADVQEKVREKVGEKMQENVT